MPDDFFSQAAKRSWSRRSGLESLPCPAKGTTATAATPYYYIACLATKTGNNRIFFFLFLSFSCVPGRCPGGVAVPDLPRGPAGSGGVRPRDEGGAAGRLHRLLDPRRGPLLPADRAARAGRRLARGQAHREAQVRIARPVTEGAVFGGPELGLWWCPLPKKTQSRFRVFQNQNCYNK